MKLINSFFYNLFLLILLILIGEFLTRILVDYESNFYALPKINSDKKLNIHPYGIIPINTEKFYDQEWEKQSKKKRYGYTGDSVVYGVGAGYPYRITEYMDIFEPHIEHVNISTALNLITNNQNIDTLKKFKEDYKIDKFIYLMNLTDLAELANKEIKIKKASSKKNSLASIKAIINPLDSKLRGTSSLYTFIRYKLKNIFVTQFGLNVTGLKAIELEPIKYSNNINQAANNLAGIINQKSKVLDICILIVPYEMQVSLLASKKYKEIGITFEDEFLNFETQKIFISQFRKSSKSEIHYLGKNFPESKVGSYYVYNRGDKIDFNHPNRIGHKILAEEISKRKLCLKKKN